MDAGEIGQAIRYAESLRAFVLLDAQLNAAREGVSIDPGRGIGGNHLTDAAAEVVGFLRRLQATYSTIINTPGDK
jgi:hypothetical protein